MKKLSTFFSLLFISMTLAAQDGTLDVTFGTGGRAYATPPGLNQSLSKTVVQNDGKAVIAGRATNCCGYDFSVARFNSDGRPDSTFDGDGIVVTEFTPGAWDIITTVAVQPDGKIIAGGYSDNRFAMARYLVDGTLDITFNKTGKLVSSLSPSSEIYALCVLGDGRILAAGAFNMAGTNYDFALARYMPDGSPDLTFDVDGLVTTPMSTSTDIIYSLSIQVDGKIVAAGMSINGTAGDFAIARYNANGSPDNTFNGNGRCFIDFGGDERAYSAAVQPDGKIVLAGVSTFTMALARVLPNGQPDNSFNLSGKLVAAPSGSFDQLYSVLVQNDGKIMAGGISFNGFNNDYAVLRLNGDGTYDAGFGTAGVLRQDMGADEAYPTLAGWNDKILMGGYSSNRLAVARLNNSSTIFVLPLRLLSFSAAGLNGAIRLQWRTASQAPLSYYVIEHSTDGCYFSPAGTIADHSAGNPNAGYVFEYRQPGPGLHYFRLKMVDGTGAVNYSQVLAVNTGSAITNLLVLQNPVRQTLQLQLYADDRSVLQIADLKGSIISRFSTSATGINAFAFDVAGLRAGAYSLIFTNRNGTYSKLFIKQ